jgi:hypothetical protein
MGEENCHDANLLSLWLRGGNLAFLSSRKSNFRLKDRKNIKILAATCRLIAELNLNLFCFDRENALFGEIFLGRESENVLSSFIHSSFVLSYRSTFLQSHVTIQAEQLW